MYCWRTSGVTGCTSQPAEPLLEPFPALRRQEIPEGIDGRQRAPRRHTQPVHAVDVARLDGRPRRLGPHGVESDADRAGRDTPHGRAPGIHDEPASLRLRHGVGVPQVGPTILRACDRLSDPLPDPPP